MATWTSEELKSIGTAEELQIAGRRSNDTLRKPVTIWVIRLGDDLYVRSVNGRTSAWFSGVQMQYKGHIRAGGVDKDVSFIEETGQEINDRIDEVYRTKYHRYAASIIDHINSPGARSATLKLVPSSTGS